MPYTAPSQPSPSAHQFEQSFSDNHQCAAESLLPHSTPDRPHRNRSYSSTSYVRRHRRSPSTSKAIVLPDVHHPIIPRASLRQSPPPVSNAVIPRGALISPPESAPNSSDEESPCQNRDGIKLEELEAAVRSIEQRRESSPERRRPENKQQEKSFVQLPLSQGARKISHSRSSTDSSIAKRQEESACISPSESDREDETPRRPQPMVRKKSGELVRPALRPASRRRPSSMPGTPTYSKAVHFDSQLEHIRHFLRLDKPLAVSAETSPVDEYSSEDEFPFGNNDRNDGPSSFEWELRLANFPKDLSARAHQPVRLERLSLSSDKTTLIGTVAVANIAFQKLVVARFTFDYWKTVSEVTAEYSNDIRRKHANDGYDRFTFSIKLADQANLEKKTMFVCIRYNVNGQEFWDSNNSTNYQADFLKIPKSKPAKHGGVPTTGSRPALPRSRSSGGSHSVRPHSVPPSFDDFSGLDQYLAFGRSGKNAKPQPVLSRDTSDDFVAEGPKRRDNQARQAFGTRYDFGASLSAAMRTKPTQDRTELTAKAKSEKESEPKQDKERKRPGLFIDTGFPVTGITKYDAHSEQPRPSSLVSGKPHLQSSVYKELVDKYCFYASSKSSTNTKQRHSTNKTPELDSSSTKHASLPFTLSPTSSPDLSSYVDSASSTRPRVTRSPSPSTAGLSSHTSSSVAFGYSYHQSMQNGFLTESQTPAVIRG